MKLGFLIQAHKDPEQVVTLYNYLVSKGFKVWVHWDNDNPLSIPTLPIRVPGHWGHISLVEQQVVSFHHILKEDNECTHYCIASSQNIINGDRQFQLQEGYDYFVKSVPKKLKDTVVQITEMNCILCRQTIELGMISLPFIKPNILHIPVPDEVYWLRMSRIHRINPNLLFAYWQEGDHPRLYTERNYNFVYNKIYNENYFMLRKASPELTKIFYKATATPEEALP